MKTPAERGPVGAWAYEARADADLSVEEVVERLTRAGQPVSAATIRGIEGGSKKPSRRLLRALGIAYGRPVPGETEAVGAVTDPAVSALVAAISELVEELRLSRAAQATIAEEQMHALAALAGGRALPGTPDGDGHAEPAGTGR